MKYSRYLIAYFVLLFFAISIGFAQEDVLRPHGKKGTSANEDWSYKRNPIILGVEGGLNYNMFSQTMAWEPTYLHGTVWNGLNSASGLSPHFGVLADIPINKTFSVQLRVAYDIKNYGVSTSGTDIDIFNTSHDMNLRVDVTSAYITLTPLLRINATDKLFFTVGPTFHFLSGDVKTEWKPTSLDGTLLSEYPFWGSIGNLPSGSMIENESSYQKTTRVGLEAGVGYKIPLSKSIYLVPQGRFQLMFTPVTVDKYWTDFQSGLIVETSSKRMLNTIQLALALWFEL